MAYDPNTFNISPYYDDFSPEKGFLRVLFKPGYAVQARELTQLQTILQNQLSKIGDHLFKDGSRIVGGAISVRNSSFVMVKVGSDTPFSELGDYSSLVGGILTSTSAANNTKAKVVHYINPDFSLDGHLILIVDFISGESFTDYTFNLTATDGKVYSAASIPVENYSTSGLCKLVSVDEGIFYINGFFVRTDAQQFTPYNAEDTYRTFSFGTNFQSLTKKIGFDTRTSDAITEKEDNTLRDPAIGSYNYNAPGADRYKIVLSLNQVSIDQTPDDFVELLRFENGRITKKVDRIAFGEIQKALAQRTFDESGSYTVRPFDITVKPRNDSTLNLSIGEGKAYVLGYEVENQFPQTVPLPKGRDLQSEPLTESERSYSFSIGNFIGVCADSGGSVGLSFSTEYSRMTDGSVRFIGQGGSPLANTVTGFVHGFLPLGNGNSPGTTASNYRMYLYGVSGDVSTARIIRLSLNNGDTLGIVRPLLIPGVCAPGALLTTWGSYAAQIPLSKIEDSSLVFEIKPGYAINRINSFETVGKISSDLISAMYSGAENGITYEVDIASNFTEFSSSIPSGVLSFLSHPISGTNNTIDLGKYALISRTDGNLVPQNRFTLYGSSDNRKVSIVASEAGHELLVGGLTTDAVRMVCPVLYRVSDTSNRTQYRTKTNSTSTHSFFTNLFVRDEIGRRYFELPNLDVYSVQSITDTEGNDYSNDFELDDGQRETHYQKSRLYIKTAVETLSRYNGTQSVQMTVSYSYFQHGDFLAAPFLGKHSYFNTDGTVFPYENIPLFTNQKTGKTVSLANCIDFRRSGLTSDTRMLKPYGEHEFGVLGNSKISYNHYLPRIDKLCVKQDPEDGSALFFLISGDPDISPMAPPDPIDALVVATITVPAYTHNPSDVVITPVDTKRFTMADIGKINKRVDEVEVFTKLSLSESEIESRSLRNSVTGITAAEPLKTSIFSDEFYGHSISDVTDTTNICSIDFERGELRPFFTSTEISLGMGATTNVVISNDGVLTLRHSPLSYIDNTQYTRTIKINPSNTVNWLGFMKLSKSIEPYYDTGYRPVVKTNALMENDNWTSSNANNARGFGTQWNEWESLWTGIEQVEEEQDDVQKRILDLPHSSVQSAVPSVLSGNSTIGVSRKVASIDQKNSNYISARQLKNRIRHKIGSRVVDRSVVPYIPTETITAHVSGLKPNSTNLSLYFDGEVVKTGITTDSSGSCSVNFGISAGTHLVGNKVVRISDSDVAENSTIAAETFYYCSGLMEQRSSGSYSVLPPELRRQTAASETVSKDPFNREVDSVESTNWSDPVSQTFFVDKKTYPEGIFLSSVNLYFAEKDSALPVTLQIRPTVSGYPSPSVVLPFSTVTKQYSEVNANPIAPTATNFSFNTPVYLEPGEYAICVLTNSDKYELFAADSGINAVAVVAESDAKSGRAGTNQLVGTLFTPQGIGAAVPNPSTDLMFAVNRCEFVSQGTITYSEPTGYEGRQILKFYAPEIVPSSCTLTRRIENTNFLNNQSLYPKFLFPAQSEIVYSLVRGSDSAVSPMIYISGLYAVGIKLYSTSASPNRSSSRYTSRVVELPDESASNSIHVFADANTPPEASNSVNAWVRYLVKGESNIFNKQWISMTRITPPFASTSEIDFREIEYSHYLESGKRFTAYQVRLDIGTSTTTSISYYVTSAVRNIRTVSAVSG